MVSFPKRYQSEVYIGSGAGFQNQDYPVFLSDSDCKFLNFGFITWLERSAKGGGKLPVELFYPCDLECGYEFQKLCFPTPPQAVVI